MKTGFPSLADLRARYAAGERLPPPKLLRELALDPRKGAQDLYRALSRKREGARAEAVRLDALLNFERLLWQAGVRHVAGVDEVGMGPLAGPVVAAAVVLPPDIDLGEVDDSKRLDPETRERLDGAIRKRAIAVSVAEVDVADIDRLNIYHAGIEAMRRAVSALSVKAEHVLTDARKVPGLDGVPQNAFDKGDGLNYSIACASIVAKVHRDRRMCELAGEYPGYGFERHKGYGTAEHTAALKRLGACPLHRMSFPVIRQIQGEAPPLFYELKDAIGAAASADEVARVAARVRASAPQLEEAEVRKLVTLVTRRRDRLPGAAHLARASQGRRASR